MAVVVEGTARDEIAVDDAGLVDVDAAADLKVEFALRHRRHATPFHAIGPGGNLDAVTDARDRLVVVEKPLRQANEVLVFADVFGGASAGEEDTKIFFGLHLGESEVGLQLIPFPLAGDRPAGTHLMHHHLIESLFRRDHDGLDLRLLEAVERIERVDGLRRVADNNEGFSDVV